LLRRTGPVVLALLAVAAPQSPAIASPLPAPRRQESDVDAVLTRALALHQSGDLQGAAALYIQVLRVAPGAARIRSNLGAAYAGLGRYEEAIEEYRKALETLDDDSIRRNLALALQKAGHTAEAAEEARRVLLSDPTNRDALLMLAECDVQLGKDSEAIDLLEPAAAAAPGDKAVAYLLGTALLAAKRAGDAQVVIDRVFRDDTPEGHVLLGSMYSYRKDWKNARAEYEKALAANPKLPMVHYLYGEALMKESYDWQGAKKAFREELEIQPAHFESILMLGTLLREEGSNDEALALLTRAAGMRPDDLAAKFSLGAALLSAGKLDEARVLLEAVAAAAPSHLPTEMQLAILYTRMGDTARAKAAREAAVRLKKEADARPYGSAGQGVSDLIGQTAPAAGDGANEKGPAEKEKP
jgi:tetratricopeptide (TPR) repeat protein